MTSRRLSILTLALITTLFLAAAAHGQSLADRINDLKNKPRPEAEADAPRGPSISRRLAALIDPVKLSNVPARQAFEWWSKTTGVSLVINWDIMTTHGIEPDKALSLDLHNVPAGTVLSLLMQMIATDQEAVIFESTPWYIQIMTKTDANKNNVVRIYDISDLLLDIPNFDNAPQFNLSSALTSSSAGGGSSGTSGSTGSSGGSSSGLFGGTGTNTTTPTKTEDERSAPLIDIIKKTIEPTVWDTAGGAASIKMFQGRMIVSAPLYVQRQIGTPSVGVRGGSSYVGGMVSAPPRPKPVEAGPELPKPKTAGVDPLPAEAPAGVER